MKKIILSVIFGLLLFLPIKASARDNVTDWYIKQFDTEFVVGRDSTLVVTERITADCGNLPDKHGIFRVLPTKIKKTHSDEISTPVYLYSITDFNDKKIPYTESKDYTNNTITWKIGNANKTVQGVNNYKIVYEVKNIILMDNPSFDEFYWNLNGAFWDLEIDNFSAKVIFPEKFDSSLSELSAYSGGYQTKVNELVGVSWTDNHTLSATSKQTLLEHTGITVSATAPKGIFTPYVLTDRDNEYYIQKTLFNYDLKKELPMLYNALIAIGILFPFGIFYLCLYLFRRYGKDPRFYKTIMPEFEIPKNLAPMEMGLVMTNGRRANHFITASIIHLAVTGYIRIEKIAKKNIWGKEDYKLILLNKSLVKLAPSEQEILKGLFGPSLENDAVLLSVLENQFITTVNASTNEAKKKLKEADLIDEVGKTLMIVMIILSFILFSGSIILLIISGWLVFGFALSSIIMFFFAIFMPRHTLKGLELAWRIKGFKLYMTKAEKYRQKYNEKENIMEKFLPYAILFKITDQWIKNMQNIYGAEYVAHYTPIWFYGGNFNNFDAKQFNSMISNFSTSMNATMVASSSGAGGGGFSGGGGGGGGGGGW